MTSDTAHEEPQQVGEVGFDPVDDQFDPVDDQFDPVGPVDEVDDVDEFPRTDQVRIVGAERAADAVAQHAAADRTQEAGATQRAGAEPSEEHLGPEDWAAPAEPQMPHWTEAPTGEIPAVLSRRDETDEDDPWATLPEPTWREERHDWDQEESLAASLLAAPGEGSSLISEADEEERQPWSFDLSGRATEDAPEEGHEGEDFDDLDDLGTGGLFGAWAAGDEEDDEDVGTGATAEETSEVDDLSDDRGLDDSGEKTTVLTLPEPPLRRSEREDDEPSVGGAKRTAHRRPAPQPRRAPVGARPRDETLSQRTGRNIPAAVVSGIVVGGLALLAFHFGTVPSMVVVTVVLTAAAVEAYAAFHRAYRPATLLGIVAVAGLLVGTYDKPFVALPVVVLLLVAATFLWHLVGVDRRADPVRSTAATLLVFCWVGVFGSYAALLLAPSLFPHRTGIAYLLGALIAAVAYDVGALVVGAWVGRHPLTSVSPGKTWEGVVGGAVAAIVFAVAIVHLVHPWTLGQAAVLGVVVAVVSPIGDLCESLVKRHLGLKDMGRILPGHGGLLDRVDGLLFVLPAVYYLVRAFGHG